VAFATLHAKISPVFSCFLHIHRMWRDNRHSGAYKSLNRYVQLLAAPEKRKGQNKITNGKEHRFMSQRIGNLPANINIMNPVPNKDAKTIMKLIRTNGKISGYQLSDGTVLSKADGVALAQRVTVDNVKNVNIAKKAIKKAFQNQIEGKGYSIVEVLSTCPTNWGMSPVEALDWLEKNMVPYYPLGVYKDGTKGDRLK